MTNAEKYKDAIMSQMYKTGDWAVNKRGEITPCCYMQCAGCKFRNIDPRRCIDMKKDWLNSEYKTKKHFTEADKAVLRALDKVQWVARDKNGVIYGYGDEPYKGSDIWVRRNGLCADIGILTTAEFAPVKWEDEEPTSRAEILGEEK